MRELLAAAEAARKRGGRVDTVFEAGDRVLPTKDSELLNAADVGRLHPRWDGPFTVTACPSTNAYTPALPPRRKMRCSPTVDVDRLKPFFARADEPPPQAQYLMLGRKASTRWTCCSSAAYSAA